MLHFYNTQRKHVSYIQQNSAFLCHCDNKHLEFIEVFLYQLFA